MAIYSNSIALLWKCKLLWKAQLKPYFKSTCHRSTDILEVVAKQISLIGIKRRHEDINENLQKKIECCICLEKAQLYFRLRSTGRLIFCAGVSERAKKAMSSEQKL